MVSNPSRSGLENGVMRVIYMSSRERPKRKNTDGILPDDADMVRAANKFKTVPAALGNEMPQPQKIIIDTDPGQDDAVAIMLALASPELDVLGITAVAGNVPLRLTEK